MTLVDGTLAELRCDDCAFRPGTDASRCERTVLLANLCAEAGEVFNCHRREGLCAGWAQKINELGPDWLRSQPPWKQTLRKELIELIHLSGTQPIDLNAEMDRILNVIEKSEVV
jgi:hypothetical protein